MLRLLVAVLAALVAASVALVMLSQDSRVTDKGIDLPVSDKPYVWEFDASQDLQEPELPTGCEATALSTLLRMNGVSVTKTQVADAMPKSNGEDFVQAFWGDPYSVHGWSCMAPCSQLTAAGFLVGRSLLAYEADGIDLEDLPLPACVWVTIGMQEPVASGYEQDGYALMCNPHCIVLVSIDEGMAHVVDPLVGETEYPTETLERTYEAMGAQAVYIAKE